MNGGQQGAVKGEMVQVDLTTAKLDELKGKLAGKIVLLGAMRATPDITEPLFRRYTDAELKEMEIVSAPGWAAGPWRGRGRRLNNGRPSGGD